MLAQDLWQTDVRPWFVTIKRWTLILWRHHVECQHITTINRSRKVLWAELYFRDWNHNATLLGSIVYPNYRFRSRIIGASYKRFRFSIIFVLECIVGHKILASGPLSQSREPVDTVSFWDTWYNVSLEISVIIHILVSNVPPKPHSWNDCSLQPWWRHPPILKYACR